MGIILKISLRNMRRRKFRYILTAIALLISVALFGGVLIVSDSFQVMMVDTIDKQLGSADVLFKPENTTDNWFNSSEVDSIIRNIDHVQSVAYRISGFTVHVSAVANGTALQNSTSTDIYGIDIHSNDEKALGGQPYILASLNGGTTIEELLDCVSPITGSRVMVISQSLKIELGPDLHVNDTVYVKPNDISMYPDSNTSEWLDYTVVAIIRDVGEAKDFDPSASSGSSSIFGSFIEQGPGVFVNIDNAHILSNSTYSHPNEYNLAAVGTDDIYVVASVTAAIQKALDNLHDGKEWKTDDLKSDSLDSIITTMSTLKTIFLIFGIIALILAIILMMNIFNIIRKEQEYETGMFQAIGASKSETFRMFLTQGLILGVIGSLAGTISSYFISFIIFSVVIQSIQSIATTLGGLTIESFNIVLYPQTVIITFIIGLIASIVASIYPSWKASRRPIIECLNPIEEKSKRFKKHYLRRILLFIVGGLLMLYGFYLRFTTSTEGTSLLSSGGNSTGYFVNMFSPMLILFGILWILALLLKPLNKVVVNIFKPYLRRTKLLTENNILRHRKRTTLTFVMIALTTSFLIGISTMMTSISAGVATTIDNFMGADIKVYAAAPYSFENSLVNQSGVEDVMGVAHPNAQFLIGGDWVGHASLDTNFKETITMNVVNTDKVKEKMSDTIVISPTSKTFNEIMDEIDSGNNIVIMEDFSSDYNIKQGDVIPVKITVGITYANASMLDPPNPTNAQEDTVTLNMTVSAIIKDMRGFSTTDLLGFGNQAKQYNTFMSWTSYQPLLEEDLPGGATDIMLRQKADTSNSTFNNMVPNWFNFSTIEGVLNGTSGVDYYTTRMDYFSMVGNGTNDLLSADYASVVGIHTNTTGNIMSDTYFGSNTVNGTNESMESLLNYSSNVCVVDERFIAAHPELKVGSDLYIFPFNYTASGTFTPIASPLTTMITVDNGTQLSGNYISLVSSDNNYLEIASNQTSLDTNITLATLTNPYITQPARISIEAKLNTTVDNFKVEAFNYLTFTYDTIGYITNTTETTYTFDCDINQFYIEPYVGGAIMLRFVGMNSTYNGDYLLSIDSISIDLLQNGATTNDITWAKFTIVGIVEAPTYYNTEKYDWLANYEAGYDINNVPSIYINYDKARDIVYEYYRGSNYTYDKVTSVLIHCNNPENISFVNNIIKSTLNTPLYSPPSWTSIDIKSFSLYLRSIIYDWFVWIDPGKSDEAVLDGLLTYIESQGYPVIFSFTRTFMNSTFNTMINLLTFITNSLLIFCIVIAMIGLMLHSLLTTMSRRREIGMLRSIGLSKRGVIRSISGETYVLSVLGLLAGLGSGIYLGQLMVDTMPSGGFLTVTFAIPWLTILYLIAAVVITVILSARLPAQWAARLNIIDAVRTR